MSLRKNLTQHLSLIADLMEFKGENRFKINAFRNGANIIRRLDKDIETLIQKKVISEIKGIGKGLQSVIYEYYQSGNSIELQSLLQNIPVGILDLMNIKGLGARKIRILFNELNISSIEELEKACLSGSIAELKGFGSKTQEKILKEIERIKSIKGFVLLSEAINIGNEIKSKLALFSSVKNIEITGELRRRREIISRVEFIAAVEDKNEFSKELENYYDYTEISDYDHGINLEIFTNYEPRIFIYLVTDKKYFPVELIKKTGSEEFLNLLTKEKFIPEAENEEKIFGKLGYPYIIPEMREKEYFEVNAKFRTNSNLAIEDFNGLLHFHTIWSDGINSLEEMINTAKSLGFKYAAVCDHSKTAFYANGLKEEDVLRQKEAIEQLNKMSRIKIYHGIESDILRDGRLDYNDDFLKTFDFIVASIHSLFNLSENEMTNRMVKAIENPFTNLIGHPTGRLLLKREPYAINMKKVIDACSQNDVAIEINAHPNRLDLDWRLIYYAREKGCKFAINPDAHSIEGLIDVKYGIMIARKGGIQKSEVINTFDLNKFEKFLSKANK